MLSRCGKPFLNLKALRSLSRSHEFVQLYSYSDVPQKKSKLAPLQERRMIDRFRLLAKGGDGGSGCVSFRRSRHVRRGRADGGNGGRGGDVILECSSAIWDLSSLQHHINAKRGGHGAPKNMVGSRGADKVVQVPIGTVIHLVEGEIPSEVEKSSSEALDPWNLPGSLDMNFSESSRHLSTDHTAIKSEKSVNERNGSSYSDEVSASFKRPTVASAVKSPLISHLSEGPFHQEICSTLKDKNSAELESIHSDDDMLVEECEEELVTEHIEYNVAELTKAGQRLVIARGGDGGLGNIHSEKSFRRSRKGELDDVSMSDDGDEEASVRAGLPGSEVNLLLELKSIADVGLVGMPNAGKSTLLGAMSRARPTVGHYAFTTLRPNLGNLNYDEFSVTVADIPGLIRGAHENRGLGHAFLRHIERTKVLAYVVDLAAALNGGKGLPPWEQLRDLILELEFYREGLSDRPSLVVANKIDEAGAEEVYEELKQRVSGVPIFPVCAVLEEGIPELKDGVRMLVAEGDSYRLNLDNVVVD